MKRTIIFLLCLLAAAAVLTGCVDVSAGEQQPEPSQTAAVVTTQAAEPTAAAPAQNTDGLNAAELMRIRFTAIQPAKAEKVTEFYSDMTENSVVSGRAEIPGGLIDALCDQTDNGPTYEFLDKYGAGTQMTLEELLAETDTDAAEAVEATCFRVDMDNDGTEDIITHNYGGGSGGFASIVLFSGSEGFDRTASVEDIYSETVVLRWENKNYLCVKNYNYYTKQWLGYTIYAFADGKVAAITDVCKTITGYTSEIKNSDTSYKGIEQIAATLDNDRMPSILAKNDGVIYGTAETTNEELSEFSADINNDGTPEKYTKYMFYPSNMGMEQHCVWNIEGVEEGCDPIRMLSSRIENFNAGQLYTFWLDEVDGDNILYMYFGHDSDFELCAYKLEA